MSFLKKVLASSRGTILPSVDYCVLLFLWQLRSIETLHAPRSSILLPGDHFVALGGWGEGGVSSGNKCKFN